MKLLVQPGDGITPLVQGINAAKKTIEVLIFRFDRFEIESALVNAVGRGVAVRALIAYTNRGGERSLRALEMRLLAAGVTVARTADDLVRYHGKMMIIDGTDLYLMAFNLTNLDIERSRSFAIVTNEKAVVQAAQKLFDADSKRVQYEPEDCLIVSPINARRLLTDFIKGAKRELLIYDPAVSDPSIVHLLQQQAKADISIRILGKLTRKIPSIEARKLFMRLHTRMIVRDGEDVFIGSQSLRTAELDARREVGMIFHDPKIAARLAETFNSDWTESQKGRAKAAVGNETEAPPPDQVAKKVAKAVAKALPPVAPVLEVVVRELVGAKTEVDVNPEELEATVRDAVKNAIREVVTDVVGEAVKGA